MPPYETRILDPSEYDDTELGSEVRAAWAEGVRVIELVECRTLRPFGPAEPQERATLRQTDIPGLWDVVVSDGETFTDLSTGQVHYLARSRNWKLEFVDVVR